jgi:PH (Pleckstrin Homology) domain-containing protein
MGGSVGMLDGLMENAPELDLAKIERDFARVLVPGERIEKLYQLLRDLFVFANKRLILVDRQGLTGNKVGYHSLPYGSITHFSVETAGHFELDAELKGWISGSPVPIQKRFNKQLNIYDVQSALAGYVLG